mgnify:CR=1 FL=1
MVRFGCHAMGCCRQTMDSRAAEKKLTESNAVFDGVIFMDDHEYSINRRAWESGCRI